MDIREFLDARGVSPFARWFDDLDARAAVKVTVALARMEQGNVSNAKSVGQGVQEYRIDWGPNSYRLYFGRDGDTPIILLCGGTKRRQEDDIAQAKKNWSAYKRRKTKEG